MVHGNGLRSVVILLATAGVTWADAPVSPSTCAIVCELQRSGDHPRAVLAIEYRFRTLQPHTRVLLGGRGAFATEAKFQDGGTPVLQVIEDGLAAAIALPGEHVITARLETPITLRGGRPGFEISLPRAAITTIVLQPSGEDLKAVTLGTRLPAVGKPTGEFRQAATDITQLVKPFPLGPTDVLHMSWEPPKAAPTAPNEPMLEADITVRVDDERIETTALLSLVGPRREWMLELPRGSEVSLTAGDAVITPPADPQTPIWHVLRAAETTAALLTVRTEQPRGGKPTAVSPIPPRTSPEGRSSTNPSAPGPSVAGSSSAASAKAVPSATGSSMPGLSAAGPTSSVPPVVSQSSASAPALAPTAIGPSATGLYAVGPYFAHGGLQHVGAIRMFVPRQWRIIPQPAPEVRRVNTSGYTDEETPDAAFRYQLAAQPKRQASVLVEFELRPAVGFIHVQPHHRLSLTPFGWKLRSEYRIAPVRTAVSSLTFALPAGWQSAEFTPMDIVEQVTAETGDGSTTWLRVDLDAPRREPFELALEARWPLAEDAASSSLPLPLVRDVRERDVQITVSTSDAWEIRASVREQQGGSLLLTNTGPGIASIQIGSTAAWIDLAWQPAKYRLRAENQVDATLMDRHMRVVQRVRLKFDESSRRAVRLAASRPLSGCEVVPPLRAENDTSWTFTPGVDVREAELVFQHSVPVTVGRHELPIIWVDALDCLTRVRCWSVSSRLRVAGFDGPWSEALPEAVPGQGSLPVLTLQTAGQPHPLALRFAATDGDGSLIVERAALQWWLTPQGGMGRSRYLCTRWPATLEVDLSGHTLLTAMVNGRGVEPLAGPGGTLRFALPEPVGGETLLLDLRVARPSGRERLTKLDPPQLRGAIYRQPVRWQCQSPAGSLTLALAASLRPALDWDWLPLATPTAAWSEETLVNWLARGEQTDTMPGERGITACQAQPESVTVWRLPEWPVWVVSSLGLVGCLVALMSMRAAWSVPLAAVLAGGVGLAAILMPLALAPLVPGLQVGLLLALGGIVLASLGRFWWARFTNGRPTFVRVSEAAVSSAGLIERPASSFRGNSGSSRVQR